MSDGGNSPQIQDHFPSFLRKIIDIADSPEDGDILLLGTLTALRIMEDGCFEDHLTCTDADFDTALIISEALLHHTVKVFEELPRLAASGSSTGQKSVRRQLFLDKLPDSFTRKDFIDISASLGIPLKTAERHISQWCKDGLIERIEQGKYVKR